MGMLFDSSALIAAFVETHLKHSSAHNWVSRAKNKEIGYIVAAHTLTEVYSVLTRSPFKPRISPSLAKKLIFQNIKQGATIVSLTEREYFRVIERMENLGLSGGIIYDAIIFECAIKAGAKEILTSNTKDFTRLIPDNSIKIVTL